MTPELGVVALACALASALALTGAFVAGARLARAAAQAQFIFVLFAFGALAW